MHLSHTKVRRNLSEMINIISQLIMIIIEIYFENIVTTNSGQAVALANSMGYNPFWCWDKPRTREGTLMPPIVDMPPGFILIDILLDHSQGTGEFSVDSNLESHAELRSRRIATCFGWKPRLQFCPRYA